MATLLNSHRMGRTPGNRDLRIQIEVEMLHAVLPSLEYEK